MLRKISPYCKLCNKCFYYKRQNDACGACDYIGIEEHSRIFDDKGEKRLKKGMCDKFRAK